MPLNLPSIKVISTQEVNEHEYHFYAVPAKEVTCCPECSNPSLYRHSKKTQLYMDTPMHGKRVGIMLDRTRYRCKECNKTFFPLCSDLSDKHRATNRLVKYIQDRAMERTCTSVAHDVGVSEGNIRKILRDYIAELDAKYTFETPVVLGIDEAHLNKKMRLVLTNIKERTIIDLVDNRKKTEVIRALSKFKQPERIKIVTIDMWKSYRDAVAIVLPKAIVVIDKFHVIKMANEAVDKGRKSIKDDMEPALYKRLKKDKWLMLKRRRDLTATDEAMLSGWTLNYPDLHGLYEAKESFFDIFDSKMTRAEAEAAYIDWKDSVPSGIRKYFSDLERAMTNWHKEVFNYFDHRYTNAYTESANNIIKYMYKQGRGYSFDVLRARVLFQPETHKVSFKKGIGSGVLGSCEPPKVKRLGVGIIEFGKHHPIGVLKRKDADRFEGEQVFLPDEYYED